MNLFSEKCRWSLLTSGKIMMKTKKALFISHTAQMGGAEFSILEVIRSYPGKKSVLLLQNGPLVEQLQTTGADIFLLPWAQTGFTRTSGFLKGLPLIFSII